MYVLPLLTVAYYNFNTWIRIDSKHRKYYITFLINIAMCLIAVAIIIIKQIQFDILSPLVTAVLIGISIYQKQSMITDLKNGKYLKKNNSKKKR